MSALDDGRRGVARVATDRRLRWTFYAILLALLLVLSLFPRPYVARAKILPQENGSAAGLGSMIDVLGGRLNDISALLGQRSSIEAYLLIGRSNEVVLDVIKRLNLTGPGREYPDAESAREALSKKVDIHALLGGTLEVEVFTHDAGQAMRLTNAYVLAINKRIGDLSRLQVEAKRNLVHDRFIDSTTRVAQTEQALSAFRARNRLAEPLSQFGAAVSSRASLEGNLQAKLVELQTVRRFAGDESMRLRTVQSEISALRQQIEASNLAQDSSTGLNLAAQTQVLSRYYNLYRDYQFAQGLFNIYSRFSEQVELQELAAESGADIQILEAPHLDAERHYNVSAVALLAACLTLILFVELYAPATGLHLPMARRIPAE